MTAVFSADFLDYNNNLPDYDYFIAVSGYSNEQNLYDILLMETYNKYGVECTYYQSTFDTNYNKVFGEDGNRQFTRSFPIMTYYQLPKEMELWSKFGIEGLDNFQMSVSKRHFSAACIANDNIYVVPKVGDVIKATYNNRFYEVIDVGEEEEIFLQKKHTWILTVSVFRDEHVRVSNTLSADILADYTDKTSDIFDLSATIETENDDILYDQPESEDSPDDVWGGF